jgi:adenine deaminase
MQLADKEQMRQLMKVALGKAEADLAIVNGDMVNVYTGEVLRGDTVLIKGDRIAYVGQNAAGAIGPSTEVIDAAGKTLIPGLIDGHTHIWQFSVNELLKYCMKGGTTTFVTETVEIAFVLGYTGIVQTLRAYQNQPIKILATAPPMVAISPVARQHPITLKELGKLLKRKDIIGLGEAYWGGVVDGDERVLSFMAEAARAGKTLDGHSAGASGNKLQAYIATGITSCHEPISAEEVMERLRLGMFVLVREGNIRKELDAVARIKDEAIDFRRMALATDGFSASQLINDGYMECLLQKAINLGFDPITAIQMVTINPAQRFALDDVIGGIAPGRYADIVIIPDLRTIQAEYVISNGRVVAKNGQLLVQPRKHRYPESMLTTVNLPRDFKADDFIIPVESARNQVKVRVIDQVTNLVTGEALVDMPVSNGQLQPDVSRDILKVAVIERMYMPGKAFTGLIRGIGLREGAIASSMAWDCCAIVVVGASETDMAQAVNRIRELNGGTVACAGGKILAEIALPVGGMISTQPAEAVARQFHDIQQAAAGLGFPFPDMAVTLNVLTTPAIPFLRITEHGLVDIKTNRPVSLVVG